MPRPYKASNKRVVMRAADGKFRRTTFADIGIPTSEVQEGFAICAACGHGSDPAERWSPILRTGVCGRCGSQEKDDAAVARQKEAMAEKEWEALGEEGQRLFARLLELHRGPFIDPFAKPEILEIKRRLTVEFGVRLLKERVPGWR